MQQVVNRSRRIAGNVFLRLRTRTCNPPIPPHSHAISSHPSFLNQAVSFRVRLSCTGASRFRKNGTSWISSEGTSCAQVVVASVYGVYYVSYSVLTLCTDTLYRCSYTALIHCTHTLHSYTALIHPTHTPYTPRALHALQARLLVCAVRGVWR